MVPAAASLITVLTASLVGSLHCVAMCGPLATLHLAPGARATLRLGAVHALGRLFTYATLGALAGAAGRALDLAGELASVQRGAAIVAGLAIVAWGVVAIVRVVRPAPARPVGRVGGGATAFQAGLVRLRARRPTTRAAAMGVLTGMLPCGWLWAFVVVAAGAGSSLGGALVMATFWLGTVPAMLGVSTVAAPLVRALRARLPIATALVLVALGVATLAGRWQAVAVTGGGGDVAAAPLCHGSDAP